MRRHVLEIKKETREWLSEELDGLKLVFVAGKGVGAVGETAKGMLSHPMGFASVALPVIATITALLIRKNQEDRENDSSVPDLKQQYESWEESFAKAITAGISGIPGSQAAVSIWMQTGRAIRDALFEAFRF